MLFFFQAEDGIRDHCVTGVQTCALPILLAQRAERPGGPPPCRPDVRPPILDDPGRAVARLHARGHPEIREPPQIVRMYTLDVHDLMACIARTVDVTRVGHGVERRTDASVAGRVRERL